MKKRRTWAEFLTRVSLSSPKEASHSRILGSSAQGSESNGHCSKGEGMEDSNNSWLSRKIKHCDKIVGVTVHDHEGAFNLHRRGIVKTEKSLMLRKQRKEGSER